MLDPVQCREYEQIRSSCEKGDEFPHRLCDRLPPVTAILYYRWLAAGLHDKIISQGVGGGGHRVYVGIRHPCENRSNQTQSTLRRRNLKTLYIYS